MLKHLKNHGWPQARLTNHLDNKSYHDYEYSRQVSEKNIWAWTVKSYGFDPGVKLSGQKPGYRMYCRFCKVSRESESAIIQHFEESHNGTGTRLAYKNHEKHTKCPIPGCFEVINGKASSLRIHLEDREAHNVEELLSEGIPAWILHPEESEHSKRICLWLLTNSYCYHEPQFADICIGKQDPIETSLDNIILSLLQDRNFKQIGELDSHLPGGENKNTTEVVLKQEPPYANIYEVYDDY